MTAPESMILIEQESRWTKFQRAWKGKFSFFSGPSAEQKQRDEQGRKRKWQFYLTLGLSVGMGSYGAYHFYEPIDLSDEHEVGAQDNLQLSALAPAPALNLENADASDEEDAGDEEEGEEVEADVAAQYDGLEMVTGPNAQDRVMDAIEQIESWTPEKGAFPINVLGQYLFHRKVWVRLTALEFAIDGKILPVATIQNIAIDIGQKNNRGQIKRYLERPRHLNHEVYIEMRRVLSL